MAKLSSTGVKEKLRYSKINLKGFMTTSALQEILKGVFPAKMKRHWAVTQSHEKKQRTQVNITASMVVLLGIFSPVFFRNN